MAEKTEPLYDHELRDLAKISKALAEAVQQNGTDFLYIDSLEATVTHEGTPARAKMWWDSESECIRTEIVDA